MKKSMVLLVLLVFAATGAFAQAFSLSAGGGGLFDWSFYNGVETMVGNDKHFFGTNNMSFSGFLFFDATYAELEAGFAYGLRTAVMKDPSASTEKAGSLLQAGVSLLLKYPLEFDKVTFFPLLGVSYNMVFVAKDKDGNKVPDSISDTIKNLSQFGLLGGVGFDFTIVGSLFLRMEALFHLRFADKAMKDYADITPDSYTTLGMSPRVKIGVGYKFF